jgi:N-methylhydantoinase A/oxoprolinase/acetone carboxylase beta subunit
LSGPAAGIVGYAKTSYSGEDSVPVIVFDMVRVPDDIVVCELTRNREEHQLIAIRFQMLNPDPD